MDILMWASHVVSALVLWVSGSLRRLRLIEGKGLFCCKFPSESSSKLLEPSEGSILAIQIETTRWNVTIVVGRRVAKRWDEDTPHYSRSRTPVTWRQYAYVTQLVSGASPLGRLSRRKKKRPRSLDFQFHSASE